MNLIDQILVDSSRCRVVVGSESISIAPFDESPEARADFHGVALGIKGLASRLRLLGYLVMFHEDADSPLEEAYDDITIWKPK